jgi:hypothetical protein
MLGLFPESVLYFLHFTSKPTISRVLREYEDDDSKADYDSQWFRNRCQLSHSLSPSYMAGNLEASLSSLRERDGYRLTLRHTFPLQLSNLVAYECSRFFAHVSHISSLLLCPGDVSWAEEATFRVQFSVTVRAFTVECFA